MQKSAYVFSALLHTAIILWLWMDWSFIMSDFDKTSTPVIMIDLNKVQIGELTNLPPKVKKSESKKTQKAQQPASKKEPQKTTPTVKKTAPKPEPKPEPVKPKEQPKPKNTAKAIEPPKKELKKDKKEPKKAPEKQSEKAIPKSDPLKEQPKKKKSDGLKSLLASVDEIKKKAPASTQPQTPSGQEVQEGIEGGTQGSLMQPLTISEKDLIVNKLRECWNVNAGVQDAEKMIVEVKVLVGQDGQVREVNILNMNTNPVFRSVAESARRAVWICNNKGDESPFRILAKKRPDTYHTWKEIFVRFSPLDGVF